MEYLSDKSDNKREAESRRRSAGLDVRYRVTLPDADYWAERIPCQMGCPVRTDSGRYVQLISEGDYDHAYITARSPNPLASICGRICAAPCETKCRRGKIDSPVTIRSLKRFVTEKFGVESRAPLKLDAVNDAGADEGNKWAWHAPAITAMSARDEARAGAVGARGRVAVVGAGPAGLACAHDLALYGFAVTVYEASARAGGMAMHGIPAFRLPRGVIEHEVNTLDELGVEMRYETKLTAENGIGSLLGNGYDACFVAVGLMQGRDLKCEGSELDGIVRAIDYLLNINNGYRVPKGENVLVLGGGFVAFDAARMALRAMSADERSGEAAQSMAAALDAARIAARAGAQVTLACLESYDEMPVTRTEQGREEFDEAVREGIRFLPQRGISAFTGDGRVARVKLRGVARTYDDDGRFNPQYDDSVSEEMDADLVILAIGQQADLAFITPDAGIEITHQGTIHVEPDTLATTNPRVFAGGDVAFGPRNLIDAVADGKRAAQSIRALVAGGEPVERRFDFRFEKIPTRMYERTLGYDHEPRMAPPTMDMNRRSGISEVETVFAEREARIQAERCLACHIQTIYDPEKCTLCNRCVDVCLENCLKLVPLEQVEFEGSHLEDTLNLANLSASRRPLSAMLKDDERCIRCGLCAVRCPTDAMTMEVMYYEAR